MAKKNFSELFDLKEKKWSGFSLPMFAILAAVVVVVVFLPFGSKGVAGSLVRPNFLSIFAILAIFGIFFGEIGDRIPFWNDYVGGGTVLVFVMAAVVGTYNLVPESLKSSIKIFYGKQPVNFMELFIAALIVGAVLTVNRKTLLQAITGYIPLILVGVLGASVGGMLAGLLFGKAPLDVMMNYVLPIMGGGTGAGAIPMSEMWASKTGKPAQDWFAFAISILTIANVIAILTGAMLKKLGEKRPELTGNGQLIIDNSKEAVKDEEVKAEAGQKEFASALVFAGVLFMFANMSAKVWSSMSMPFDMHRLAFLVIYCIILNALDVVPTDIKAGAKNVQSFFSKHTIWILMAAVGLGTNVTEIIDAAKPSNIIIAFAIVQGAVIFIMACSRIMKFYAVEAAITAGLCMANRGGSGDIAVLGAADRMELISFAQISSRVGGAMMLIIGSIIFGIFA